MCVSDQPTPTFFMSKKYINKIDRQNLSVSDFNNFLHFLVHLTEVWNQKHCTACLCDLTGRSILVGLKKNQKNPDLMAKPITF